MNEIMMVDPRSKAGVGVNVRSNEKGNIGPKVGGIINYNISEYLPSGTSSA